MPESLPPTAPAEHTAGVDEGTIDDALDGLRADGTLARPGRRWLGTGEPGTTTSVV